MCVNIRSQDVGVQYLQVQQVLREIEEALQVQSMICLHVDSVCHHCVEIKHLSHGDDIIEYTYPINIAYLLK